MTGGVIVPRLTREGQKGKGGPSAHHSKANKEARLMERNICFILDAGVCVGGRVDSCPKADPPFLDNQWTRAFYRQRGLQSAL